MSETSTPAPGGPNAAAIAALFAKYQAWEQEILDSAQWDGGPDDSVRLAFEIVHMGKAFEYHLTRVASGTRMTALQARFAWILATAPYGMPTSNLAIELGISLPSACAMVLRMHARGLVRTEPSPADPRAVIVSLTDRGLEEWREVRDRLAAVCDEVREALGEVSADRFADDVASVTALDERHPWFEALRNPMSVLA